MTKYIGWIDGKSPSIPLFAGVNMKRALEVFFSIKGRIPRGLYWAASFIQTLVLIIINLMLKNVSPELTLILYLPFMYAGICITGKRFHDRNKSAWWTLISFIPVVGPLWIFIECGCLSGSPRPNRFGYPGIFGSESIIIKRNANQTLEPTRTRRFDDPEWT